MTAHDTAAIKAWARALDTLGAGPAVPAHYPETAAPARRLATTTTTKRSTAP